MNNKLFCNMYLKKKFLYGILITIVAITPCFELIYQENRPNSTFDDVSSFSEFYQKDEVENDSTSLFLDISLDKIPVQYTNEENIETYDLITNRSTLIDFLRFADSLKTYKCILLDISFDNNKKQFGQEQEDLDSILKNQLDNMYTVPQRLFVIKDDNIDFNKSFKLHSFKNDFKPNKYNMFVRSTFIYPKEQGNSPSFEIFKRVSGLNVKPTESLFSSIFTYDWHIFMNNPILKILKRDEDLPSYDVHLGDFLRKTTAKKQELINNRVIVIGDFCNKEDSHSTYAGEISGPYLTYCEYRSLEKGGFLIKYRILGCLLFVYILLSLLVLNNNFSDRLLRIKNKIKIIFLSPKNKSSLGGAFTKGVIVLYAMIDVLLKYLIIILALYICTKFFYYHYDYLYCATFATWYFTIIQVLVVFVRQIIEDEHNPLPQNTIGQEQEIGNIKEAKI